VTTCLSPLAEIENSIGWGYQIEYHPEERDQIVKVREDGAIIIECKVLAVCHETLCPCILQVIKVSPRWKNRFGHKQKIGLKSFAEFLQRGPSNG